MAGPPSSPPGSFHALDIDLYERGTLQEQLNTDALDGPDWALSDSLTLRTCLWGYEAVLEPAAVRIYADPSRTPDV